MKIAFKILLVSFACLISVLIFASCNANDNDISTEPTEAHTHSFGEWIEVTPQSCTESGLEERSCECGKNETRKTVALGHTFGGWTLALEATCATAGYEERVCMCGEKESRTTAMLDHDFENGICKGCELAVSIGLEYVSNGDGTCYVSSIGSCTDADIVIPEEHNGERVTGIGEDAFEYSDIVSVVIPDSVVTIEDAAFFFCEKLERVTLGNGVTDCGIAIFSGCLRFHAVYINDLSAWCENAVARRFPLIRELYLHGELLTDVVLPEGITEIKPYTFASCESIKRVTLPEGLTKIGERAFSDCSELESISIPDSVTSIGEGAFSACHSLTSINIPNGIKIISEGAFSMSGLTSVVIPKSVNWIAYNAFSHCKNLTSVIIVGSGNTSIDAMVFYKCEDLTSIMLGRGVVEFEASSFSGCENLVDVYYGGTIAQWNAIDKPQKWNDGSADRVIHCTDGDVPK